MDVSITAVNVARVPAHAVPSLPVGGVFAWPSPRTREQVLEAHDDARERERQNGECVVRAEAPDEANVSPNGTRPGSSGSLSGAGAVPGTGGPRDDLGSP
jgi:hypothetical protein